MRIVVAILLALYLGVILPAVTAVPAFAGHGDGDAFGRLP